MQTLLLVGSEADVVRTFAADIRRGIALRILCAASTDEALNHAQWYQPEYIFIDSAMQSRSGNVLSELLAAASQNSRVLVVNELRPGCSVVTVVPGVAEHTQAPWAAEPVEDTALTELRRVFEKVDSSVVMCDSQGVLRFFNHATRQLHGISEELLPSNRWAEHYQLYDEDNQRLLTTREIPLFRALEGETLHQVPIVIRRRNGTFTKVLVSGNPLLDDRGRQIGAIVIQHPVGSGVLT
ncbi:MAG TPA: PAS domain-containing protein, partial [Terriglobales bacterium]